MTNRPVTNDMIIRLARACAYDAVLQGATAPWGDGDMQSGDLDALTTLLGQKPDREHIRVFECEFRRSIADFGKDV